MLVPISAIHDTKITNVCLYSGFAEVTRIFKANLKVGDNNVVVSNLPVVLLPESLRVDGRGPCTIHEVSVSEIEMPRDLSSTSAKLTSLTKDKARLEKALTRCKTCISAVQQFQNSLSTRHVTADRLGNVGRGSEAVAAQLDDKLLQLEDKIDEVAIEIQEEKKLLGTLDEDDKLRKRVSITIVADKSCEVEVVLVYGVSEATWDAAYDIYVNTNQKEKQATLLYKAAILQNTGEPWENISLKLETATPTFGLAIPELTPWRLSEYRPWKYVTRSRRARSGANDQLKKFAAQLVAPQSDSVDWEESPGSLEERAMPKRVMRVTSKGDISASFAVPGLIAVPSDGASHNVTVCELALDAVMSWVSVPKKNARAHLMAKIKNDSEYTLLKGVSSVYVDGSFISRSDVPPVSPQETFDCPLGIDPSVRITYHPRSKKINRSGFTRKTCSYTFEQRITIVNAKATSLSSIKVHDQIPVSEDEDVAVHLIKPPLKLPIVKKGNVQPAEPALVKDEKGFRVIAKWDEMDEEEGGIDPTLVGKSGKMHWVLDEMPVQSRLHLVLSWEVVCASGTDVMEQG